MKLLQICLFVGFFLVPFCSWGTNIITVEEILENVRQAAKELQHKDLRVRLSAIEGLQSWALYASEAAPALIKALKDESPEVRAGAAHALELMGPRARQAVPELTKALSDSVPPVRAAAAFALGQIGAGNTDALGVLLAGEKNAPPRVSLARAFALQKLFPGRVESIQKRREVAKSSIPLLMSSLSRSRGFETIRLARAIGTVDPAIGFSLVPRLVALACSKDAAICSNSSYALETLGQTSTAFIPGMIQAAQRGSDEKRISAIKQLSWMRVSSPEALRFLGAALSSGSTAVRSEAAEAFSKIGTADTAVVRDLARLAKSREATERRSAAYALLKVSPQTLDKLMPHLKKQDPKLAEGLELKRLLENL